MRMKKKLLLSVIIGIITIALLFFILQKETTTSVGLVQEEVESTATTSILNVEKWVIPEEGMVSSSSTKEKYSNIQFRGRIESIDLKSGIFEVQAGKIWTSEDLPGDELGKIDVEISSCEKLYENREYTFIVTYYPISSRYVCNKVGMIIYD